jgi:hypothetical protein
MVCNVIEECRCYAYDDVKNPKKEQFCGVRKGPHVIPCPKDCCAGGCPGKIPKQPFRIIKRPNPKKSEKGLNQMTIKVLMYLAVILGCIFLLLL